MALLGTWLLLVVMWWLGSEYERGDKSAGWLLAIVIVLTWASLLLMG